MEKASKPFSLRNPHSMDARLLAIADTRAPIEVGANGKGKGTGIKSMVSVDKKGELASANVPMRSSADKLARSMRVNEGNQYGEAHSLYELGFRQDGVEKPMPVERQRVVPALAKPRPDSPFKRCLKGDVTVERVSRKKIVKPL